MAIEILPESAPYEACHDSLSTSFVLTLTRDPQHIHRGQFGPYSHSGPRTRGEILFLEEGVLAPTRLELPANAPKMVH